MQVTGSRNFISTDFASTRRKTFRQIGRVHYRRHRPNRSPCCRRASLILVAENERQQVKLIRPRGEGGDDLDGVWNDDLHHSAMVALARPAGAYFTDYLGAPQEFISAAKYGYLYQGQPYSWQGGLAVHRRWARRRKRSSCFIENHDQISNTSTDSVCAFKLHPDDTCDDSVVLTRPMDAHAFPR